MYNVYQSTKNSYNILVYTTFSMTTDIIIR